MTGLETTLTPSHTRFFHRRPSLLGIGCEPSRDRRSLACSKDPACLGPGRGPTGEIQQRSKELRTCDRQWLTMCKSGGLVMGPVDLDSWCTMTSTKPPVQLAQS